MGYKLRKFAQADYDGLSPEFKKHIDVLLRKIAANPRDMTTTSGTGRLIYSFPEYVEGAWHGIRISFLHGEAYPAVEILRIKHEPLPGPH